MPVYRYDVGLTWNGPGGPGVNVWHIRTVDDAGPNPDLEEAAVAIRAFYNDVCEIGLCPAGWTARGPSQAINVADSSLIDVTSWTEASLQGTATFSAPSMVCVGLRTASATRAGRGRKFIGPLATPAMGTDGTITDSMLSSLRAAAATLANASQSNGGWAVGVYSQSSGLLRDVVTMPVRDTIATLRSRRD